MAKFSFGDKVRFKVEHARHNDEMYVIEYEKISNKPIKIEPFPDKKKPVSPIQATVKRVKCKWDVNGSPRQDFFNEDDLEKVE